MLNVFTVADFFVDFANQCDDDSMTNLKLNKLLYYAQGHYAALTGRKLFNDDIEAWDFGPVVPSVYHKYKICGRNRIADYDISVPDDCFTDEQYSILLDVAREYAKFAGSYLVEKTHQFGTPWKNHWSEDKRNIVIPIDEIKSYFSKSEKIITFDEILENAQIPLKKGHRNPEGVLVFPEDGISDDWLEVDEM